MVCTFGQPPISYPVAIAATTNADIVLIESDFSLMIIWALPQKEVGLLQARFSLGTFVPLRHAALLFTGYAVASPVRYACPSISLAQALTQRWYETKTNSHKVAVYHNPGFLTLGILKESTHLARFFFFKNRDKWLL